MLLALNSAEDRLQLVLGARSGQVFTHAHAQEWTVPGKTMQHLAPALEHALARLGCDATAIAAIACVRGPGSFTGLRLTLATALGLARALDVPLAGIDYLPLLAAAPAASCSRGSVWVLTHARRNQVYVQGFRAGLAQEAGGTPEPLCPPRAAHVDEAAALVADAPLPARLLGSGLRRNMPGLAPLLDQGPDKVQALPEHLDHPSPTLLLQAAQGLAFGREPIEPLYIRVSDAEENLAAIAQGRGLSLAQAQRILRDADD